MERVCEVCGNAWATASPICPFCGSKVDVAKFKKINSYIHKTINLEAGRPAVDVALSRLQETIEDSARNKVNVLTLIHGYGSSGKGGKIRIECRKTLDYLKAKGIISEYIAGENFSRRSGVVKSLLRRYPQLGTDQHLNKGNRGITLVLFTSCFLVLPALLITYNATLWS